MAGGIGAPKQQNRTSDDTSCASMFGAFSVSCRNGVAAEVQVILKALQKYGMFVADNGGDWFISGAPDPRWNDANLRAIKKVKGKDFEVVQMGKVVTR